MLAGRPTDVGLFFLFLRRLDLNLGLLQHIGLQLAEFERAGRNDALTAVEAFGDLHGARVADAGRHRLLVRLVLSIDDDH